MLASTCESVCVASAAGVGTRTSLVASPRAATLNVVPRENDGARNHALATPTREPLRLLGRRILDDEPERGGPPDRYSRARQEDGESAPVPSTYWSDRLTRPAAGIRDGAHRRVAAPPPGPGPVAAHSATPARPSPAISVPASDCSSRRTSTGSPADAARRLTKRTR